MSSETEHTQLDHSFINNNTVNDALLYTTVQDLFDDNKRHEKKEDNGKETAGFRRIINNIGDLRMTDQQNNSNSSFLNISQSD